MGFEDTDPELRGIRSRAKPEPRGRKNYWYMTKLTEGEVRQIRKRHAKGESLKDLAGEYDVTSMNISKIVKRQTWRHVK